MSISRAINLYHKMSEEKLIRNAWRFTEKFVCDCSALVTDYNYVKHIKTRKHLKFLSNPTTPVRTRAEIIKHIKPPRKYKINGIKSCSTLKQ